VLSEINDKLLMAEEGGRADLPICYPTVRKFVVVITGRHQTENYSVGLVGAYSVANRVDARGGVFFRLNIRVQPALQG